MTCTACLATPVEIVHYANGGRVRLCSPCWQQRAIDRMEQEAAEQQMDHAAAMELV